MMTESFMYDVERAIAKWVVANSRYKFEHLTASADKIGIQRPLRDLFRTNVATLLRNTPRVEWSAPLDMASCLMTTHRKIAACYYDHITGVPPPEMTSQRKLYQAMQEKDETPILMLGDKLAKRKEWDPGNGETLARRIVANARSIPVRLTPALRTHLFELVHNALPTKSRMKFFYQDRLCSLCGRSEETIDHLLFF